MFFLRGVLCPFVLVCGMLLTGCSSALQDMQTQGKDVSAGHGDPKGLLTVLGPPSLSAAFIDQVLSTAHSPAAGTGELFYSQSVKYGIDDAVALAFFQHESTFGKHGVAASSLNIGNLRCLGPDFSDLGTWCREHFAYFPHWSAGIEAWYRLMRNLYVTQWGLTTVDTILPRYAPADDGNSPTSYVQAVKSAVSLWRAGKVAV